MLAETVKNNVHLHAVVFISGDISNDLSSNIGQFIGRYFKYRPAVFCCKWYGKRFSHISYRQQAKRRYRM